MKSQIPEDAQKKFFKAGYRMVGTHSAVEICHWTRESLRKDRVCFKEKWYGIKSHRCLEMTPALTWCTHNCIFCWRPLEFTKNEEPKPDDPKIIVDGCIEARRKLLTGFGGREGIDLKKLKEAMEPTSVAISLAGEPTLYPRIAELIEEFNKRNMISFLVTNGTRPDRLKGLTTEPSNLYITITAIDGKMYAKMNQPLITDGWKKINESLALFPSFKCNKVVRLTLVNNLNFQSPEKYAQLISKTQPDFVEVKSYSWVGESRLRLPGTSVIPIPDLKNFAQAVADEMSYELKDIEESSRVVQLARK